MQRLELLDISSASNLTRLSFRGCRFLRILDICKQPELEILDLRDTVINYFSNTYWLEQLRYLYLSDIKKIRGGDHFHTSPFPYRHIYAQTRRKHHSLSDEENHLEISGGNKFPEILKGVPKEAKSLHLHDNGFIVRVSDMDIQSMVKLRYFSIERCCQFDSIIVVEEREDVQDALESLESLQVSDAAKLTTICRGKLGNGSFACLKHIYLHLCPKLVCCFHSITCLRKLESLEIKFCARLKKVFEEVGKEDQIQFPSLKRICLLQLPKLQSICSGMLPKLEELKVRGCSKLEKLPLHLNKDPNATSVKIRGEMKWWANINGGGGIKQPHIMFKPWRSFSK